MYSFDNMINDFMQYAILYLTQQNNKMTHNFLHFVYIYLFIFIFKTSDK